MEKQVLPFIAALSFAMLSPNQSASGEEKSDKNVLLRESPLPYEFPRFDQIRDEDFVPAIETGMAQQLDEIRRIADQKEQPSFDNTIVAMERSGRLLRRAQRIFSNLNAANTNATLQKIEAELAPKLAAHQDAIHLNSKLFGRVESLYRNRDKLGLDAESGYLLERYYKDFVRAGARLPDSSKEKLKGINAELASLQTQFEQNALKEKNASSVVVSAKAELAGLSDNQVAATTSAAKDEHQEGKFVVRLQNTSGQPILASLQNRALREHIMEASLSRNSKGGPYDNRDVVLRIVRLRSERARLLGYRSHASYQLEDQTAKNVETVNKLLGDLTEPAVANARERGRRSPACYRTGERRVRSCFVGLGLLLRKGAQGEI